MYTVHCKYNVGFIWMVTPQGPFHRLKSYSVIKRSYHAAVHVGCMYIQWTVVHHYMYVVKIQKKKKQVIIMYQF